MINDMLDLGDISEKEIKDAIREWENNLTAWQRPIILLDNQVKIISEQKIIFSMVIQRSRVSVRIFGVGVSVRNVKYHSLRFSERQGYKKYLKVAPWVFNYLPKLPI